MEFSEPDTLGDTEKLSNHGIGIAYHLLLLPTAKAAYSPLPAPQAV
jgi:hypothetical protein